MESRLYRAELDYGDGKIEDYIALFYPDGSGCHRVLLVQNIEEVADAHVGLLNERKQELVMPDFPREGFILQYGKSTITLGELTSTEIADLRADITDRIHGI